MPAVVSIVVGKDYKELLRDDPYSIMVPHGDHYDVPKEEDLPHTKGGRLRVGGGSGFLIDSAGLILTNKHVARDLKAEYLVSTVSQETYPARIVAQDPLNDVAVLKIEETGMPWVKLGNSNAVQLGQTVLAVGTALGEFQNTVSSGIISGLARHLNAATDMQGHTERLRGLIQTDAAINPGNSGGPLINTRGEVVGINSAVVFGAQNLGFAIPVNTAKRDIGEVKKYGRIRRPFLGVRYILLNDTLQKRFGLSVASGALVLREAEDGRPAVVPDSPAARAGIKEEDVILELNDTAIDEHSGIEDVLEKTNIGDDISMKVLRGEEKKTLHMKAEERPKE